MHLHLSTTEVHEYPVQAMTFWVIAGAAVLITAIIIKERFK